jgi:ABC-type multidrug transport system permease subunit
LVIYYWLLILNRGLFNVDHGRRGNRLILLLLLLQMLLHFFLDIITEIIVLVVIFIVFVIPCLSVLQIRVKEESLPLFGRLI